MENINQNVVTDFIKETQATIGSVTYFYCGYINAMIFAFLYYSFVIYHSCTVCYHIK